jgi:BirA family biotin operon repressor/biotin-[acetyl-CoA-carboxylase] ligase
LPQPLPANPIGVPFIELQSVDSSNNYARERIREGPAQHGMAFFAHEQVAGKGQRGKTWMSEKGSNIILTVLLQPHFLTVSNQFYLNACMAIAVHDFFYQYAGNETKIKWPNDIYWQDKKAGGMLIENIVQKNDSEITQWKWSIVGIGININQTSFPVELQNPVSLKQITGKNFDPVSIAKELCKKLDKYYHQLMNNELENIFNYYISHLYKKNETVKLKKGSRIFEGVIKTVSASGQLIVQHTIEEQFDFGEVEWK